MSALRKFWEERLAQQKTAGLWRTHRVREHAQSVTAFNTNDYLGMSHHPEVIAAFQRAADHYGVGSGSANTLSGYTKAHDELRQTLREWLRRDEVLLFSSGYQANLAVLTTLLSKQDLVFADKLNHASLNDGMRFSEARFKRYAHLDYQSLAQHFEKADDTENQTFIVTESLFSMDGDIADLHTLSTFSDAATIIVDEAHSLGLYGPQGAGLLLENNMSQKQFPIMVGTFGKSIGTQGAFVAGDKMFIDALMQFARPYLFTTAMAPALAAATNASVKIIQTADSQREYLQLLIKYFRVRAKDVGIRLGHSSSVIQPIIFDNIETVNMLSERLTEKGMSVSSIRYPTVPMDAPRLRISLTVNHTVEMIDHFFEILHEVLDEKTSDTNCV